ncbi:hypothetical protein Pint_34172 [Pistacia integerrima]|uniref:Uncharacterized protein n=2 Tax=Pistacia TaxID=55512 RepID=A0ACC1A3I1_9ROSI|nr:hypothetical protein Pint_34172 [Pistacia integerrima]KAJ0082055.1 hypothetical protein Patl1_10932 [Pistacia atlantica]
MSGGKPNWIASLVLLLRRHGQLHPCIALFRIIN